MTIEQQIQSKVRENLKKSILETSDEWYQAGVAHNMAFINWLNGKDYSNGKE